MKLIYRSPIFDLVEVKRNENTFVRILSPDWVNIVALNQEEEILLIEQFRIGIDSFAWETPGGIVDKDEDLLKAAQRELLEESGYGGGDWEKLGVIHANPAFQNNRCHFFLAKGVTKKGEIQPDPNEEIRNIRFFSQKDVKRMLLDGTLTHGVVTTGLLKYFFPIILEDNGEL